MNGDGDAGEAEGSLLIAGRDTRASPTPFGPSVASGIRCASLTEPKRPFALSNSDMKILSLDPSSTCTGYAVLQDDRRLLEAGKLRGKSGTAPMYRVLAMREELRGLLDEHAPDVVVIEMPLGRQYTRRQQKFSSMAVWAGAAWAIWAFVYDLREGSAVYPVDNTDWTQGVSKDLRQKEVWAEYGDQYDPDLDKGQDVSDAIKLALWWLKQKQRQDLLATAWSK